MKREIVVGVAGVAMAVAACAGCSSNKSNSGAPSSSGAPAPAATQLIVDGQNQNISGAITCNTANGVLTIGVGDATAGIGAVLSTDNPPIVHSVGLGNVNNVALGFSDAAPNQASNAGAAVNGKSYAIKGTATGTDMTNPQQPQTVTKPFELDVTCP
ncbi:lipoprotein LpqH [Mycobacterium rhizamassiliense]|uniref:lipoprotein LpqH n=1 Tax=Mycobacterium rhizamassiliense TaxID=1841860 RepID=UPI00097D0D4F|nr:lipoprotein LpqH [Mycobacterium rhizamassiliense]